MKPETRSRWVTNRFPRNQPSLTISHLDKSANADLSYKRVIGEILTTAVLVVCHPLVKIPDMGGNWQHALSCNTGKNSNGSHTISFSLLNTPKLSPPITSKTFFHPTSVSSSLSISLKLISILSLSSPISALRQDLQTPKIRQRRQVPLHWHRRRDGSGSAPRDLP